MYRRRIDRFPTSRMDTSDAEWWRSAPGNMVRMYGDRLPPEFERIARTVQGPVGDVRQRVGPFVYGYDWNFQGAAERPLLEDFGHGGPAFRGRGEMPGRGEIQEPGMRAPFVDLIDSGDHYRVLIELPGVDKGNIRLDAEPASLRVDTEGERKFFSEVYFAQPVKPETAKAIYRNGLLNVEIQKREGRQGLRYGTPIKVG